MVFSTLKESRNEYNGLGRLMSRTEDGRKVDYTIDYTSALPRNLVETVCTQTLRRLYGLEEISVTAGSTITYMQHDRLGSIV